MISALVILIASLICLWVECVIITKWIRFPIILVLIYITAAVLFSQGIKMGQLDQLNRFARLLPEIFSLIQDSADDLESQRNVIQHFRDGTSSPTKLDGLEMTINNWVPPKGNASR